MQGTSVTASSGHCNCVTRGLLKPMSLCWPLSVMLLATETALSAATNCAVPRSTAGEPRSGFSVVRTRVVMYFCDVNWNIEFCRLCKGILYECNKLAHRNTRMQNYQVNENMAKFYFSYILLLIFE